MSRYATQSVTNNHELALQSRLSSQFRVWANRWRQRHELMQWSDRDLHDVGLSWSDVVREAEKPFWRA